MATAKKKQKNSNSGLIVAIVVGVLILAGIIVLCVGAGLESANANKGTTTSADATSATTAPIETTLSKPTAKADDYTAVIDIKGYGKITMDLDGKSAPETVNNFVALAQDGFYDGLTFHRIIEDFMMQGGDPNGDGTGGSDKNITGEFSANGIENNLKHTRGAVSMARSSDMNSASSQFFIVHQTSTHLDGQYAVFGYVTDGMDIVDEICESAEPTDNNGSIAPKDQPVIKSITVKKK